MENRHLSFWTSSSLGRTLPFPSSLGTSVIANASYRLIGSTREHSQGYQVFQYSLDGCGSIDIRGKEFSLEKGKGFLCNIYDPDVVYYYSPRAREPWSFIYLVFRNAEEWVRTINMEAGYVFSLPMTCAYVRQIRQLISKDTAYLQLSMSVGLELINTLFAEICRSCEHDDTDVGKQRLAGRAISDMREHIESSDGIAQIANRLGVSVAHLCRVFRQELNVSPLIYLQRQKLRYACSLLCDPTVSIKEITRRIGISNVANFTRLFKQHTGITPGKFRLTRGQEFLTNLADAELQLSMPQPGKKKDGASNNRVPGGGARNK